MTTVPEGFESLFAKTYVEYADADTIGSCAVPPPELVHRIHLVATPTQGKVTVCSSVEGWRFLPGGRVEPGESVESAATRELFEEAGGQPTGPMHVFFSYVARSRSPEPYLPNVPHPVAWWTFAVVPSRIVGPPPTGVEGGESIVSVDHLPVADAIEWLSHCDDPTSSEVLRFAAHLQLV